jgi:uncharacterized membrane protein YdbT with pleckstrin-like domain
MALNLRDNESLKIKANFHWSSYLIPAAWALFGALGIVGAVFGQRPEGQQGPNILVMITVFFGPLVYKFLSNKCKDYSVTNQRLYIEEGIISKKKKDIPLQKINDLEVNQGIIQRFLGSGNILVLTGNDKPTKLTNIDNPETFKNSISEITGQISHKAANVS